MDSGYYALSTALIARTQALDTIANNLANSSTTGYLAERNVFSSVLTASGDASNSSLNRAINNYGVLGETTLDMSQGALQKTGNDLDLALQGSGFFVVQTAKGTVYTRNGALSGFEQRATDHRGRGHGGGGKGADHHVAGSGFDQCGRDHLLQWSGDGQAEAGRLSGGHSTH